MAYTLVPTELIVDGAITSAKLDTNIAISGTLGVTGEVTLATHLIMGDNDKIKIGTGGDLEIYHDGSNSYISNSTGNLYLGDTNGAVHIQAKLNEESIICAADGAVTLYHDNSPKLATSSAGVTVTGTLAATLSTAAQPNITSVGTLSSLTVSGDLTVDTSTLKVDSTNNRVGIGLTNPANTLEIQHGTIGTGNGSNNTLALRYNSTTLYGQHYMDANGLYHIRADGQGVAGGNLILGGDASVQIWTGSTPERRVTVDSSGNVIIGSGGLDVSGIGGTYTALNMRAGAGYSVLYGQTTATTTNSAAMQIIGATSGASAGGAAELLGIIQIAAESDSSTNGAGYMNFYTGSGGSPTEAMRISSVGNVTKPLQCNFLARRSGNQTGYNASGSYGDGVRYNDEVYDIGGDFNVTTGIFTAPVDGTYLIQGSVYSGTAGTNWTQAWLAVNGARAEYTDMMGNDGDLFISTTHIVKLSAGDEVRYHPYYSGSTSVTILENNNHTWFKGYLLG
jgi:hypothetical protein